MSREHSEEYQKCQTEVGYFLDLEKLDSNTSYTEMADCLREINDAEMGITSTLDRENNTWIRDATQIEDCKNPLSPDNLKIEGNNLLLRVLSRLRPIEYVIQKKGNNNKPVLRNEFSKLASDIKELISTSIQRTNNRNEIISSHVENAKNKILNNNIRANAVISSEIQELKSYHEYEKAQIRRRMLELETAFNTLLIQALYENDLTEGVYTPKDAEALLFHYRNLSSLLDPARTLVTIFYDREQAILHREKSIPVTEKTQNQKKKLKNLEENTPYPFSDELNAHTAQPLAFQKADNYFSEHLQEDDRLLPAQSRKTHAVGVKNAFINQVELINVQAEDLENYQDYPLQAPPQDTPTLTLGRMASPVFVGKGETKAALEETARENIEQMITANTKLLGEHENSQPTEITSLNTNTPQEKQSTILKVMKRVVKTMENTNFSIIPVNLLGTFFSASSTKQDSKLPSHPTPLQRAKRVDAAIQHFETNEGAFNIIFCASGSDRTGTIVEKYNQTWTHQHYATNLNHKDTKKVELLRARSGHAAEIPHHLVHGSPGMKPESQADNTLGDKTTFSEAASHWLYRKSATTNKKNQIGKVAFLEKASSTLKKTLKEKILSVNEQLVNYPEESKQTQLYREAVNLFNKINALSGNFLRSFEVKKNLKSSDAHDLLLALTYLEDGLKITNKSEALATTKRLAALSSHCQGKPSPAWQSLGTGLLTMGMLLLITTTIFAAIPIAAGSIPLAVGFTAGLITALAGVFIFQHHKRKKSLASSVSNFKLAIENIQHSQKEPAVNEQKKQASDEDQKESLNNNNSLNINEIGNHH